MTAVNASVSTTAPSTITPLASGITAKRLRTAPLELSLSSASFMQLEPISRPARRLPPENKLLISNMLSPSWLTLLPLAVNQIALLDHSQIASRGHFKVRQRSEEH